MSSELKLVELRYTKLVTGSENNYCQLSSVAWEP